MKITAVLVYYKPWGFTPPPDHPFKRVDGNFFTNPMITSLDFKEENNILNFICKVGFKYVFSEKRNEIAF